MCRRINFEEADDERFARESGDEDADDQEEEDEGDEMQNEP